MKIFGFVTCVVLLATYALHTIWAKAASLGWVPMPFSLGEVGEFLVVLVAMLGFVVGLYGVEQEQPKGTGMSAPP